MEKSLFISKIADFARVNQLFDASAPVLVALSGGADSVSLLLALQAMKIDCRAAHCNFHLRGDESMRDEQFVRALCDRLGVELHVTDFDVEAYVESHGVSVEMACRDLRYAWFERLRVSLGCSAIAVAHHRDDNIETFFLNALRGTGISGLTGMHPRNGNVVRPLLCVSRTDILDFLRQCDQDFVVDSTNLENDVKRNKLRNIVLPEIYRLFPDAAGTIERTVENVSRCDSLYNESIAAFRSFICDGDDNSFHVDMTKLLSFNNHDMLLYEIMKPLGFNYAQCVDIVAAFVNHSVGRFALSSSHRMTVNRAALDIVPLDEVGDFNEYVIDLTSPSVDCPVKLSVSHDNAPFARGICDGSLTVAFSNDVLHCKRIVLRHWRDGDRFRPFGLRGSKLVSDLFTDFKLSENEKHSVWILEADGEILWIVGYRASGAYRVPADSCDYIMITARQ
jgi:tRNA(Ile)-lysidine synthase